jgi:hypothetical protein
MKRITLVLLTTFFLGLFQSLPAQAEVCSTGTYTVSGINTFGDLPCKDPGTAINVTVRGLHDYGVSGGKTAYCSFSYARRNLGTDASPRWSSSTDTVCDPNPNSAPAPTVVESAPTVVESAPKVVESAPTVVESAPTTTTTTESSASTDCSALNPCHTYAVVNLNGVVTNVIVCSAAVCGPSGEWAGIMPSDTQCPGCSLVLQVAANPVTGAYQGAIFSSADSGKQITYDQGTFTITDRNTYVSQEVIIEEVDSSTVTTTLTATVEGGPNQSFTYDDTVGKSIDEIQLTELPLENNVSATVSASEVTSTSTTTESIIFEERKTAEEVDQTLLQRNFNLLRSKLDRLLHLLDGWLIK